MLSDVDMMACLGNLFQQWFVLGKKECSYMSVLQECFRSWKDLVDVAVEGLLVVIHWKSSNTVDRSWIICPSMPYDGVPTMSSNLK